MCYWVKGRLHGIASYCDVVSVMTSLHLHPPSSLHPSTSTHLHPTSTSTHLHPPTTSTHLHPPPHPPPSTLGTSRPCLDHFVLYSQENITEADMQVDPKYHRHFIQRRGQVRTHPWWCGMMGVACGGTLGAGIRSYGLIY